MFLIWSHEHGAWWGPHRHGYTSDLRKAGLYSAEAAANICKRATLDWTAAPNEVPVRAGDLPDEAKLLINAVVTF